MKKLIVIIFLCSLTCFSQSKSATELMLDKVDEIEKSLTDSNYNSNIRLSNELACLTAIKPKKKNLSYAGMFYFPTLEEVKLWRKWIEKYSDKISYDLKSESNKDENTKVIVEYEDGKFRSNFCNK